MGSGNRTIQEKQPCKFDVKKEATLSLWHRLYKRDLVFLFHKEIFDYITKYSIVYKPLIIGGNSVLLLKYLINTGANSFLLDYNVDDNIKEKILMGYENFAFRINIDPSLICNGNHLSISRYLEYFLKRFGKYKHIIIGTGILPYNTPLENIILVSHSINEYFKSFQLHPWQFSSTAKAIQDDRNQYCELQADIRNNHYELSSAGYYEWHKFICWFSENLILVF